MSSRIRIVFAVGLALTLAALTTGFLWSHAGGALAAQAPTAPPTNTPRFTAIPTNTPRFTETPQPPTATQTPLPTATFTPSATPTITPTEPVVLPTPTLYYPPNLDNPQNQPTAIPTAMPRFRSRDLDGNAYELLNILLIGHDGEVMPNDPNFHTDTMIVVSINRDTKTVSMLSLPRDLFVFIPNWGMGRLNQAYWYGEAIGWTDGGWGMLRQTILYNFGIETHYYAMADFNAFETLIDELDGIDVAVDCPIQDQWCITNCDDGIEDNEEYELQTLSVGVHHLDGVRALWYARSRRNTTDFDRGRRQQQILRAIYARAKEAGLISRLPDLWSQLTSVVDTNIPLTEILPLIPLALSIEPNDIENHFFRKNIETVAWQPPDGSFVQLPHPEGGMTTLIENFLSPPSQNRLRLENARIEIQNGTAFEGWDIVAADRLIWEGFAPLAAGPAQEIGAADTVIYDFTSSTKGSSLNELVKLLNIRPENIIRQPDPDRTVDFMVVLGENYNSCVGREWADPDTLN